MELALIVIALIAIGLLATRFGVDSRPGITAGGHDLAWSDPDPIRRPAPRTSAARARRAHMAGSGIPVRSPSGIAPDPSTAIDFPALNGSRDHDRATA